MVLIAVAFMVPILCAGGYLVQQQMASIDGIVAEREGVVEAILVSKMLDRLHDYRRAVARDDHTAEPILLNLENQMGALKHFDASYHHDPLITEKLENLDKAFGYLEKAPTSAKAIDRAIDDGIVMFFPLDDATGLDYDSDTVIGALSDALELELPGVEDKLGTTQSIVAQAIDKGAISNEDRFTATATEAQARFEFTAAINDLGAALRNAPSLANSIDPMVASIKRHLDGFIRPANALVLRADKPHLRMAALDQNMNALRDDLSASADTMANIMIDRLNDRERSNRLNVWLILGFTVLVLAFGVNILRQIAAVVRTRDRRELDEARREAAALALELEKQKAVDALSFTEAQFRAVLSSADVGVAILDEEAKVVKSNDAMRRMFGHVDATKYALNHPLFSEVVAGTRESFSTNVTAFVGNGRRNYFEFTVSSVRHGDGNVVGTMVAVKDVTEERMIADQLKYDATHDSLSGLPNRAAFFERLASVFPLRNSRRMAVLFIDLDDFKLVNDNLGHVYGDKTIQTVAARLRDAIPRYNMVARLGGDEFAAIIEGFDTDAEIEQLTASIVRAVSAPQSINEREIVVTVSVGIAPIDPTYSRVEDLLRDADAAMYQAKRLGRARYTVFDPSIREQVSRRFDVGNHLRSALERGEFFVEYQPIWDIQHNRLAAFEALARWQLAGGDRVNPMEFVPIAEELGLIIPIGRFVFREAAATLATVRQKTGNHRIRMNVNVSARELLQPDYLEFVADTIAEFELSPGDLVLEVTETAILESGRITQRMLRDLRRTGVGLAVDDFGTGYSSLRYLQEFPFSELKIDRSFISGSDGTIKSRPIVNMLITLAKTMGVEVVGEGVETPEQGQELVELGCTFAQGWYFGRPARATDVMQFLPIEELAS